MRTRLLLLCFAALALQSCNEEFTHANTAVDAGLRKTIKSKNDSLLNAMATSNLRIYKALGSDKFVKYLQSNVAGVSWLYRQGYLDGDYTVYDEYHVRRGGAANITLSSPEKGYDFGYTGFVKETYVSLLRTSLYQNDYLIMVVYEQSGKGWKLSEIKASMFGHLGRNPWEWYKFAQQKGKKGFYVDALLNMGVAEACIQEADKALTFHDRTQMSIYKLMLFNKINKQYKFPHKIEDLRTIPTFTGIEPVMDKEGYSASINYLTDIPIENTEALHEEYLLVKAKAREIYKWLDFDREFMVYTAINQKPDPNGGTYLAPYQFIDRKAK